MAKFFRTVLPETRKKAAQGDLQAQFDLALFYWSGRGLQRDEDKAVALWRVLAKKGHTRAMFMLGKALAKREHFGEALTLFQDAAANGDVDAMYEAGIISYEGRIDDTPEYEKALGWFQLADSLGHRQACNYLAQMYCQGQGTQKDTAQSIVYFTKSAVNGYTDAQYHLGVMYLRGHGVQRDYLAARKWLGKAARNAHAYASYLLGLMFFRGIGGERDYANARYFFARAAYLSDIFDQPRFGHYSFLLTPWKDGVPDALCKLCEMDAKGLGQPADMKKAAKMYAWAVERNAKKARVCFMRLEEKQQEEIEKILEEQAAAKEVAAKKARELRRKKRLYHNTKNIQRSFYDA